MGTRYSAEGIFLFGRSFPETHSGKDRCFLFLLLSVFLPLVVFSACEDLGANRLGSIEDQSYVEINEVKVPVFKTAEQQLNYTRSWFAEIHEKRAALEAFIKLFPSEKKTCGLVSLDLAYLQLGKDYRFSYEFSAFAAIREYMEIIDQYAEFPDITVKAYWYIGWIYADLLKNRKKGIEYFRKVVDLYPDEVVSLLAPAPWVSIIYQTDPTLSALNAPPQNKWAALALVEIIRNSDDNDTAWSAFQLLWQNYRHNAATGFGLRLILQKRLQLEDVVEMAREFMEEDFTNVHMLSDIRHEISSIEGTEQRDQQ